MFLDVRTLIVALVVVVTTCALVVMLVHNRKYPVQGTLWWAYGTFVIAAFGSLLALRGTVPDWLSIVVANAGVVVGYCMTWCGVRRFVNLPPVPVWGLAVTGCSLGAGLAWFTYVTPSLLWRIHILALFLAPVCAAAAWDLLRNRRRGAAFVFTGAAYGVNSLFFFLRSVHVHFFPPDGPFLASHWGSTLFFLYSIVFICMVTFGMLLMITDTLMEQLRAQATEDPLTGVANRRSLFQFAEHEFAAMRRSGESLAVLMLDLDHFKKVNDRFGHAAGDMLLVCFSRTVERCIRAQDKFFRYGGEEFVVLLPGTSLEGAVVLAERIRAVVELDPVRLKSGDIQYTVSIGISCGQTGDVSVESILNRADEALYQAKTDGRNCVRIYKERIVLRDLG